MRGFRSATLVAALVSCLAVLGCSGNGSGTTDGTGGQMGTGAGSQVQDAGSGGAGAGGRSGSAGATEMGGQATGGRPGSGGVAGGGGPGGSAGQAADGGGAGSDGGGDTTQDAGASDAGPSFAPCPSLGTACVVMPFGDSLTDGFTPLPGGYRIELFHQMLLNRQTITFVGSQQNGPTRVDGQLFPRSHEGHNGYTIDDAPSVAGIGISPLLDPPMMIISTYRPNIILLGIGTNDINRNFDVANAPTRLGALIDKITSLAPNALLVVGTIVPTRTAATNVRIQAYDAAIPALIQQRVTAGKHVLLVDNHARFIADPNYATVLLADDLHPTPAGYAVLGQNWYAAIRSFVPTAP